MGLVLRHSILALVLTTTAVAQNATFVASADRTTVGAGEQFEVSFTVSASDVSGAKNFKPPILAPFTVLSGPNQSTNMQFVNGQMSGSVSFTYYLYTRQTGKFTIAPATIEYKGTTLKSQPLLIEVAQSKPQAQGKEPDNTQDVANNLYIRALADRQHVRQGEPVTVTYKLYTRLQVSGYDIAKAPVYQGFWAEEVEQAKQPVVTTETVDGKQFRVATIRKTALFPTQSGKLTISPLEVRCAFQLASRKKTTDPFDSFFNDPFFSRTQTVEEDFRSNPLSVSVDPLPGSPPAGFTGAVGHFSFTATVDKKEVKTGDPITLKLTISGAGNVKLLTPPKPELPADFEAYDPKISEDVIRDGGVIRGNKTAEYLIIPRNAGDRAIEPIAFSYFDLDRNTYNTLHSPRFDFKVIPGKDMSAGAAIASKSDIQLLGEDIRFLKLSLGELHNVDEPLFSSSLLLACIVLPPFVFFAAFGYRKRQDKLSGNVDQLKFAKAGREASKRFKGARRLLLQGNTESYHAEVSKAIFGYLEDKLHISKAALTMDEAARLLDRRGVTAETIESLRACIERAEFARFAPASDTQEARTEILDAATAIINTLEKSLRRRA